MAAQALVRATYRDPVETYAVNVMGLVHLLDAVRRTDSVRVIVNVTSDKCYENHEWLWAYREDEPMGGYDPYSSSKGCAELVTAVWRRSFFAGESVVALAPSTCQVGLVGCRRLAVGIGIYCQPILQISAQTWNFWVLEALCSAAVT
jgi:CDP-glucose 4,6-dehydratase